MRNRNIAEYQKPCIENIQLDISQAKNFPGLRS